MAMLVRDSSIKCQRAAIIILALCANLAAPHTSAASAQGCQRLAKNTGGPDGNFRPPLSATVTGSGRAYFYSAPASRCISKHTFLIPGDTVTVYKPYKKWYQVMYVNGKSGEDFEAWLEEGRLRLGGPLGGD
ncbi:hypothetical protein [Bordetella sp. FB-8]|uniref:hypothetical protein n=1 Tax=Bordetella sp. FB-8 TaxID=1159870 RepID=UPI0003641D3B|nr:hypothetical protein [Bordetella sp. FB-8]